jgi:CubicO group peptidase (beta-lactamase class C family)
MPDPIQAVLEAAVARQVAAGLVAAAADRDGIRFIGAAGRRDASADIPMTQDTVFWIASMTKAVTAVAALQLVARGLLSLDAPLGGILPELAAPQVLEGFAADGGAILRPARVPITLRHLLTHTSGYSYDMCNPHLLRYIKDNNLPAIASRRRAALDLPLMFDPGTRWEYGIGIDWVGLAVEQVSGQTLGAYLQAHVFDPLGMLETSFAPAEPQRARLARMHVRDPRGLLHPIPFSRPSEGAEFEMGGGGLYGPMTDYIRFLRMLLHEGQFEGAEILPRALAVEALRNHIAPLTVGALPSAIPALAESFELYPGHRKGWGLLGMINESPLPSGRAAGATAWAGLANTYWWVDRTRGLCGVIAAQLLPFADPRVLETLGEFEQALH